MAEHTIHPKRGRRRSGTPDAPQHVRRAAEYARLGWEAASAEPAVALLRVRAAAWAELADVFPDQSTACMERSWAAFAEAYCRLCDDPRLAAWAPAWIRVQLHKAVVEMAIQYAERRREGIPAHAPLPSWLIGRRRKAIRAAEALWPSRWPYLPQFQDVIDRWEAQLRGEPVNWRGPLAGDHVMTAGDFLWRLEEALRRNKRPRVTLRRLEELTGMKREDIARRLGACGLSVELLNRYRSLDALEAAGWVRPRSR
jgi:hypothetical protein